jgi:hypothetical protein
VAGVAEEAFDSRLELTLFIFRMLGLPDKKLGQGAQQVIAQVIVFMPHGAMNFGLLLIEVADRHRAQLKFRFETLTEA